MERLNGTRTMQEEINRSQIKRRELATKTIREKLIEKLQKYAVLLRKENLCNVDEAMMIELHGVILDTTIHLMANPITLDP